MSRNIKISLVIVVLCVFASGWWLLQKENQVTTTTTPQLVLQPDSVDVGTDRQIRQGAIIEGVGIPWDLAIVSANELIVTTRAGLLLRILDNQIQEISVPGVEPIGEGGLLGVALDPDFDTNQLIYLYLTYQEAGTVYNKLTRFRLTSVNLENEQVLVEKIPGASNHNGGKLAFGPDGKLYVTTGDGSVPEQAQDTNSYAGKILRLNPDGSVPADNPYGSLVWAYGLRNPQGLAWDDEGRLYATDHGPSGTNTGYDELNLIQKGGNYGWPEVYGNESKEGMIDPLIQSGGSETWAPAGIVYWEGSIWFAGLRGEAIYEYQVSKDLQLIRHKQGEYGRLRGLIMDNAGWVYVTTSNRDGRGTPRIGDDKVIRMNLGELR